MRMAIFEEERPRPDPVHQLGQDLSLLSAGDLEERIAQLQAEIERLRAARAQRTDTKSAAEALFRR